VTEQQVAPYCASQHASILDGSDVPWLLLLLARQSSIHAVAVSHDQLGLQDFSLASLVN